MARATHIAIHTDALKYNLAVVRQHAPNSKIIAMIKADAYGHGIEWVTQALQGADAYGVAILEEALAAYRVVSSKPIIIFEGFFEEHELDTIAEHDFHIVVHNAEQLVVLREKKLKKPISVWLKVNTGMNRLGIAINDFSAAWDMLTQIPSVRSVHLLTHFSDADDRDSQKTMQQIKKFHDTTHRFNVAKSLSNSAGILAWPESHYDWVRPGIMLYGASPFPDKTGVSHGLLPVMSFHSELIAIHDIEPGESVGYGSQWTAKESTKVGVVAAGYGDGYPRAARNGTPVLVNNQRTSLVGRVSMDMLCVDITAVFGATIGSPVELWGKNLASEEIALYANTIPYTLFCGITQRVRRISVK